MSDYEDEMDVDAPPARDVPLFGADNTSSKGKRSAANLPVEAEDSLPWYAPRIALVSSSDTNIKPKGREISSRYARRCFRSPRYSCHYQQIRRYKCRSKSVLCKLDLTIFFLEITPSSPLRSSWYW